jgi:anti-sigma factor RsiW
MTLSSSDHLSEDDRQRAADGTLDAEARGRVDAHRAVCGECDDDVARLTALMKRIGESRRAPAPAASIDDLWPEIRRQIDGAKVVSLEPAAVSSSRQLRIDPWWIGVVAAVLVLVGVSVYRVVPSTVRAVSVSAANDSLFRLASDSVKTYEAQAEQLLDELKLERARLTPETQASIDEDLKTVDLAIAELQAAIARDPKNPTLRAMLASSYRQKIDVLKKIPNAG